MPAGRVIVVGAGLGGLATALALKRAGIDVTVLERSAEPPPALAALQIWSNGMLALRRLGVAGAVEKLGEPMSVQELRSWRDSVLVHVPIGELARKHGAPLPCVVRGPDLAGVLAGALGDGVVRLDSACAGVVQDADGVTVRLAGGQEERAAVVVAADGIDSAVRTTTFGPVAPRFAGYQYLYAVTSSPEPPIPAEAFRFLLGRGDRFGMHAGPGWTYWFGVLLAKEGEGDPPQGRKRQLLERFAGFGPAVTGLIEATPEADIERTDVRDLDPLDRWVEGRVALLGDAAHASTPNLGRGAGDALEDAVALADRLAGVPDLADHDSVVAALAAYEEHRRPDAISVQSRARRIGKVTSWRNPARVAIREQLMKRAIGKAMAKEIEAEFAALGAQAES